MSAGTHTHTHKEGNTHSHVCTAAVCDYARAFCTLHRDQRLSRACWGLEVDQLNSMFCRPLTPSLPLWLSLFLSIPLYILKPVTSFGTSFSITVTFCIIAHLLQCFFAWIPTISKSNNLKNTCIYLTSIFAVCNKNKGETDSTERSADMVRTAGQHRQRSAGNTHPASPSRCLQITISIPLSNNNDKVWHLPGAVLTKKHR